MSNESVTGEAVGGRGLEDKGPGGKEGKKVGSNALPRSVPGSPRIGKKKKISVSTSAVSC